MAILPIGRNGAESPVGHGKDTSLVFTNLPLNSIAKVEQYFDNIIHGEPSKE